MTPGKIFGRVTRSRVCTRLAPRSMLAYFQSLVVAADTSFNGDDGIWNTECTVTDQNGSHPHRHADFQENNQQCHRQNNFRHDDRNIQRVVDEFLSISDFIPLQTEGTDGTDKYGNQSTQYRNDQTVDQTVHQCRIGKELGVPLCGKTIPVIVILLVD